MSKMKIAIVSIVSTACAISTVVLLRSKSEQVLVAPALNIGIEWISVQSKKELRFIGTRNELLIELPTKMTNPGLESSKDENGQLWKIDAFLTTRANEKILLHKSGIVQFNGVEFLRFSSDEVIQKSHRVISVSFRSDIPLRVGRVIWMSYSPVSKKDGVMFPEPLK